MPTHDDADKLYKQALEAGRRGDHPQATTLFEQALTLYQTLPNTQREQANCLHNLANTGVVRKLLTVCLCGFCPGRLV